MRSKGRVKLKVALDTSVLVAALLSKSGGSAKIVELIFAGKIDNFYTNEGAEELIRVLQRRKFNLERRKWEHFIHNIRESSFLVKPLPEFLIAQCRDPKDDQFLSLALQIEADYLISLDRDLIDLKRIGEARIVDPAAFLAQSTQSFIRPL